jgi:hypothetical protein
MTSNAFSVSTVLAVRVRPRQLVAGVRDSHHWRIFHGAPGRTRTSTTLRPPDFESGASTNSATGARSRNIVGRRQASTSSLSSGGACARRAGVIGDALRATGRPQSARPFAARATCLFGCKIGRAVVPQHFAALHAGYGSRTRWTPEILRSPRPVRLSRRR